MKPDYLPRGIRNNNPLNVKEPPMDRTNWVGERATNDDPIFEECETMEAGIRMAMVILRRYYFTYDLWTVEGIISRWSETDQSSYINTVCTILNVEPDTYLKWGKEIVKSLVSAMSYVENGGNYLTEEQLEKAWEMLNGH